MTKFAASSIAALALLSASASFAAPVAGEFALGQDQVAVSTTTRAAVQAGAAQALRVNGEFASAVAQIEEGTTRAAVRSEALQAARKFIGGETHL